MSLDDNINKIAEILMKSNASEQVLKKWSIRVEEMLNE